MKLLGTLPLPDNARSWSYPVCKAARATTPQALLRATTAGLKPEMVTLELTEFSVPVDGRLVRGWALKADHLPIEKLRRIPGFIEATPVAMAPVKVGPPFPSFQKKELS